jgi:sulfatase maturation enzyme AslB (radical SAM superfamily)
MFLQRDNARPHTSAATSVSIERASDFKLFHTLPTARIWHRLTSGCLQLPRHISKEFLTHVMKKWFQEQPEEFYTDRFEKLVQRWCVVSN